MSIETITEEYKIRNGITADLTDYDLKLIKSIKNLREGYANELSKRKCSIYLKEQMVVSVFDKNSKEKESKKAETKSKMKTELTICEAVQMNGNPCKAKAKDGGKFCGRHCKK